MTADSFVTKPRRRVGVFIIGARGAVATCAALGVCGLRSRKITTNGLVTARDIFSHVPLADPAEFILGGAEVRRGDLYSSAIRLSDEGVVSRELVDSSRADLAEIDRRIVAGYLDYPDVQDRDGDYEKESLACGDAPARDAVRGMQQKIEQFKKQSSADVVIVVNLASTEAARADLTVWNSLADFEGDLDRPGKNTKIPISTLYAYAAMSAGNCYINFTPSLGAKPRALEELALQQRVPHAGCDGKTGETLMKTVLAPLFRDRNLKVLAWEGYNMLGNGDGRTLADPAHKASKITNKDQALRQLLGDGADLHTRVSIDYVPSLGDWKTAWDFIHFAGFFGTRMTLQFTWSGSDSALAAPLVLDLLRLTDLAHRRGESGAMKHTAAFFKSPLGVAEHDFHKQNALLEKYARSAAEKIL